MVCIHPAENASNQQGRSACLSGTGTAMAAMGAIVTADVCSSAMETIGAASHVPKQAVVAIVIAGACSSLVT